MGLGKLQANFELCNSALKGNQKKAHREVQRYFKENAFDVPAKIRPIADCRCL
ncbi:hypothetical protein [Pseudovibrio sp. Tun.PSC04-5.I4]|uniref:hypothetical protein n=1 Tax=Pseudovibrio sp. Tun.PSC04-5.I4 TaxID=1798213 RepID=UPI0013563A18|nr:hypothetical protein [Pseudovibrio sp. Tun.PSC04-5.I4]